MFPEKHQVVRGLEVKERERKKKGSGYFPRCFDTLDSYSQVLVGIEFFASCSCFSLCNEGKERLVRIRSGKIKEFSFVFRVL